MTQAASPRGWMRNLRQPSCLLLALALCLPGAVSANTANKEEAGFYTWSRWTLCIFCCLMILLSAMFCGLTIGLLGVDTVTLEIIASAGPEPDRSYASTILPIRKLGHHLLATLLLGNMLTLVLTSQLVAAIVRSSELVNFIVGTLVVLVFGEIIPMAYCNKGSNGLKVGVKSLPVLKASVFVLYPIAKPLGLMLDCLVSHDAGQLYDKQELKKLIRMHSDMFSEKSGLDQDQLRMMLSALDMNEITVGSAMTSLDSALMLEASLPINMALQEKLWEYGKSRVPVYSRTRTNIIGVLFVKDMINMCALQNDEPLTVRQFIAEHPRDLLVVRETARLHDALTIFETGSTQILFVERSAQDERPSSTAGTVASAGSATHRVSSEPSSKAVRPADAHAGSPDGSEALSHAKGKGSALSNDGQHSETDIASPTTITPRALLQGDADARRPYIGLVTLEDIIEMLIASEIYDEDEYNVAAVEADSETNSDVENDLLLRSAQRGASIQKQPVALPRVNFYSYGLPDRGGHDARESSGDAAQSDDDLSEEQKWALASYMTRAYVFFASWSVPKIKYLLDEVGDRRVYVDTPASPTGDRVYTSVTSFESVPREASTVLQSRAVAANKAMESKKRRYTLSAASPDRVLYTSGQLSRAFTLVLSGGVDVVIGPERLRAELHSFASLGEEVFTSASGFVPDYTAVVSRTSRLVVITHEDMFRVEGKINALRRQRRHPPVKLTTFDQPAPPASAGAVMVDMSSAVASSDSPTKPTRGGHGTKTEAQGTLSVLAREDRRVVDE